MLSCSRNILNSLKQFQFPYYSFFCVFNNNKQGIPLPVRFKQTSSAVAVRCLLSFSPIIIIRIGRRPPSFFGNPDRLYNKMSFSKEELKKKLTPQQYHVTQEQGTERAYSGKYYNLKDDGIYTCVVCDTELFRSTEKYDSGSGWPSFYDVLDKAAVELKTDTTFGMIRTEAKCKKCGAHLGHVFDDGPKVTGKRFCINSASLDFKAKDQKSEL